MSAAGTLQQEVNGSGTSQQGAISGLSAAGIPQQEGFSTVGAQQHAVAGGRGILQQGAQHSFILQTPSYPPVLQIPAGVCNEFTSLSEHNVGKLARALACRSVFGADVLKQSRNVDALLCIAQQVSFCPASSAPF